MKTFLIIFWIHQAIFGLSSLGAVILGEKDGPSLRRQ
jgi:hypothetical protein